MFPIQLLKIYAPLFANNKSLSGSETADEDVRPKLSRMLVCAMLARIGHVCMAYNNNEASCRLEEREK